MSDTTNTPWTPGPLGVAGEHKAEHGKFVYAVRETEPKGMIAGWPTPIARYRSRADAQIGALAPEMANAILWIAMTRDDMPLMFRNVADKLRAIQEGNA